MPVTIDDISGEMTGLVAFLQSLADAGTAPDQLAATKTALMQSIGAKITMLPNLDFAGGARLTTEINTMSKTGHIDDHHKQALTSALMHRMQTGGHKANTGMRKEPQSCYRLDRYLVEDDWKIMKGTGTVQSKLSHIRDCSHKIGLTNPNEQTLKKVVAVVLCCSQQDTTPVEQQYDMFRQAKSLFASFRPDKKHLPHVVNYPDKPAMLDKGWYEHAYISSKPSDDDTQEYNFDVVAQSVPCRTTNIHLRGQMLRGSPVADQGVHNMQQMMMWMQQHQQSHGHHRQEAPGIQGLQVFGGSRRRPYMSLPASPSFTESDGSSTPCFRRDQAAEYGDVCLSPPVHQAGPLALLNSAVSPPATPCQSASSSGLLRASDLAGSIAAAVGGSRMDMNELDRMEKLAKDAADEKARVDKVTKDDAKAAAKQAKKGAAGDADDGSPPVVRKRPASAPSSKAGICRVEWSRHQVVAVSGKTGPSSSKVFSFEAHGGDDGARKKARKWLAEQNA
jgi:hypothetical protein